MEDIGKYGCTIGNSGGLEREEIYLHVSSQFYIIKYINSLLKFVITKLAATPPK